MKVVDTYLHAKSSPERCKAAEPILGSRNESRKTGIQTQDRDSEKQSYR